MDLNIRGRTALVTGASSGIGLETARQLLDEGAIVVMTGPEPDELKAAVDELEEYKERIYAHDADIADGASVDDLAAKVTAEVGDLDILVNVAGIHGAGGTVPRDQPGGLGPDHRCRPHGTGPRHPRLPGRASPRRLGAHRVRVLRGRRPAL